MRSLIFVLAALAAVSVTQAKPPQQIIGGSRSYASEFPYLVAMNYDNNPHCGGSIITQRHILTAAHCVNNIPQWKYPAVKIRTGSLYHSYGGRVYDVENIFFHEYYNQQADSTPYDIAIIKLKTPITFDANTRPIELATSPTGTGQQATVAGWGLQNSQLRMGTQQQLKVTLQTLSPRDCQARINNGPIYDSQICTIGPAGRGVCMGDSGGPLVSNNKLIGVVSWGIPCGVGYPDVFTSVYHYRDWINRVIQY